MPSACLIDLVAAASRPDGVKFGLALSSGDFDLECAEFDALLPERGRRGEAERRLGPPLAESLRSRSGYRSESRRAAGCLSRLRLLGLRDEFSCGGTSLGRSYLRSSLSLLRLDSSSSVYRLRRRESSLPVAASLSGYSERRERVGEREPRTIAIV